MLNRAAFIIVLLLTSCSFGGDVEVDAPYWGDLYIADNCNRCPECCVEIDNAGNPVDPIQIANELAEADDGAICPEDNIELLDDGWTLNQIRWWCENGIGMPREKEDVYCSNCPGVCCPCVKGAKGLWWLDYNKFGTVENPCTNSIRD